MLDRRLDSRVDDMMSRGLVDELADFHHLYNERRLRDEIKYVSSLFFLFSLSLSLSLLLTFFTSEPNARNNQITRYIRIVILIIALNWLASG